MDQTAHIIASIAILIGSLGAFITSIFNAFRIHKDGMRRDEKLEQIHILVNGRLYDALNEVKKLECIIEELEGKINKLNGKNN